MLEDMLLESGCARPLMYLRQPEQQESFVPFGVVSRVDQQSVNSLSTQVSVGAPAVVIDHLDKAVFPSAARGHVRQEVAEARILRQLGIQHGNVFL